MITNLDKADIFAKADVIAIREARSGHEHNHTRTGSPDRKKEAMKTGTLVTNQDLDHPLTGVVIDTPEGQGEPDGWVWVRWSNGLECSEYPDDVTENGD